MLSLNYCVICACFLYTSIPGAVCASKTQKDEVLGLERTPGKD